MAVRSTDYIHIYIYTKFWRTPSFIGLRFADVYNYWWRDHPIIFKNLEDTIIHLIAVFGDVYKQKFNENFSFYYIFDIYIYILYFILPFYIFRSSYFVFCLNFHFIFAYVCLNYRHIHRWLIYHCIAYE